MKPRKTCSSAETSSRRLRLQWSRGGEAAEDRATPPRGRTAPSSRCFNGAAAVKPRKTVRAAEANTPGGRLQWSRGGEAAEDVTLDGKTDLFHELQWSRGGEAAEDAFAGGCGPANAGGFNGAAAVKPRKTSLSAASSGATRSLQWSRGGEAAEDAGTKEAAKVRKIRLQWSRGGEAAEDAQTAAWAPRPLRGFNGAAAVKPRKTFGSTAPADVTSMLQWSRGGEAAEDSTSTARTTGSGGFNGAAAVKPRKTSRRRCRGRRARGFNGAAAVKPRKTPLARPRLVGQLEASMEPRR